MAIAHLLEDFSTLATPDGAARLMSEDAIEDQRLAAFEQGYSAGWDDAISAQSQDHGRISAELGRSLEDLSFSYHEALGQMIKSVEPLFRSLVSRVLPEVMHDTVGHLVVEQLCRIARDHAAQPAVLVVPPGAAPALEPLLAQEFAMPVELREDDSLDPGQACIRLAEAEIELDSEKLLAAIREAMDTFFYQTTEEKRHG